MSEEKKPQGSMDPVELWKQWYDTSSRMWSNALGEGSVDPYGFYQLWLKSVGQAQEQGQAKALEMMNTKEIWNQWFEATVGAWRKAAEMGADPLGLTTQWLNMMEEVRKRIMSDDTLPKDPFTFFRQWYEATNETWAKVVDDMLRSEKLIESASPFLEVYATFAKTLRRANEEYFRNLQLPTRSDLARVAELVVSLEEKVDTIEDALENLQEGPPRESPLQIATSEAVKGLEGRLGQVEGKLDVLSATLEKKEAAAALQAVERLAKRVDGLEGKVDKVLTTLEKIEAREDVETTKPTNNVRRSKRSTQKQQPPKQG